MPSLGNLKRLAPERQGGRRKRACQRCHRRKQRCDIDQRPDQPGSWGTCQNCLDAGAECCPIPKEAQRRYSVAYVSSIEEKLAALEGSGTISSGPPRQTPATKDTAQASVDEDIDPVLQDDNGNGFHVLSASHVGSSPPTGLLHHGPSVGEGSAAELSLSPLHDEDHSMNGFFGMQASSNGPPGSGDSDILLATGSVDRALFGDDTEKIPVPLAASFFHTYFQCVHFQYPFLDTSELGNLYMRWKAATIDAPLTGWLYYFVKMIFSLGSLIQSKADIAPSFHHQTLQAQAQAQQAALTESNTTPLTRLQALLLSAMHAIHCDSIARIVYTSGAIMRFASFHGFHRLVDHGDDTSRRKIMAWSCAYALDRVVSGTLDIAVGLADCYITSPCFEVTTEAQHVFIPWLNDCASSTPLSQAPISQNAFAHICRARRFQSRVLHAYHSGEEDSLAPDWQEEMCHVIDDWARSDLIRIHSLVDFEGYQSPLGLQLVSQISRLIVCRPTRSNIYTRVTDIALEAACQTNTIFRALQKKRQIPQPWLVVLTQFQAIVTIYYIFWVRRSYISREAERASRDCTATMAVFADRWSSAASYHECLELLATAVPRAVALGLERFDEDDVELLRNLTGRMEETGLHKQVTRMLNEMVDA